jgi:hypothetical protein
MTPYGQGFRVTHEMYVDDLYGPAQQMSRALARSARNRQELAAWYSWDNAIATDASLSSRVTGFVASEALLSATHKLLLGGTAANRPGTDCAFGVTALQAALNNFETQVDDSNMIIGLKARVIIGHPNLKWAFKEVLKSEYRPYTANNERNALFDEGLDYMLCHYQTSTTQWGVLAAQGIHSLNVFMREALRLDESDDFDSGDAKFKSYLRMVCGWSDWRGVYGTSGA